MGRRGSLLLVGVVIGLMLVGAGWFAVNRARQVALEAQERVVALRESVAAEAAAAGRDAHPTEEASPAAAAQIVRRYCAEAGALERDLGPLTQVASAAGPAAQLIGQLPAGERASALLALARVGGEITTATRIACDALDPVLEAQVSGADMATLVAGLASAREPLRDAVGRLRSAHATLAGIDERQLDEMPRTLAVELRDKLPSAVNRLALLAEVPGLLGMDGRRSYAVLGQNTDEIWPTGGFIGTAGIVSVDRARVVRREYGSSLAMTVPPDLFVPAPAALSLSDGDRAWHLSNANWWPDFPSSARQAQYFYDLIDPKADVSGVVAVDQHFIAALLEVTGPINLPEYGEVVTADNVRERLEYYTHVVGVGEEEQVRKGFVRALFPRLLDRVLAVPRDRLRDLSGVLQRGLDEQHLMVWVEDTRAQETIARLGWDGRMHDVAGDYLFPVSTNFSANKINRDVTQALEYAVTEDGDGRLTGHAVLRVQNTRSPDADLPPHEKVYRDYLRLYVPAGSELVSASGYSEEPTTLAECGRTAFAGLVVVPAGETRRVEVTYRLPAGLNAASYSLLVEKQPGLPAFPVQLRVDGPAGGTLETDLRRSQLFGVTRQRFGRIAPTPSLESPRTRFACEVYTAAPRVVEPPIGLVIPKLGVDAEVIGLGADPDGTLQSPPNGELVGWYVQTARPGQPGNLIMSGHVDWDKRIAVFWGLRQLTRGDQIEVVARGGDRHRYEVEWLRSYDAATAPLQEILGSSSERVLTLITCGGWFNPITRDYTERLVVRARLKAGG